MPFTGSHPAAVLPFLGSPLPMSALVAGSMAPDSPAYVPRAVMAYPPHTHSLVHGIGINLALGLILWALWHGLLSRPALAAAPGCVQARCAHLSLGMRARLRRPVDVLLVPLGVVVGALSHVAWDNFTHPWGWPVQRIAPLRAEFLGCQVWSWAQLGGSVGGLLLIGAVLARAWARAPVEPVERSGGVAAAWCWAAIGLAGLLGALRGLYVAHALAEPPSMVPWHVLTRSLGLALGTAAALSLVWHLRAAVALLRPRALALRPETIPWEPRFRTPPWGREGRHASDGSERPNECRTRPRSSPGAGGCASGRARPARGTRGQS